MTKPICSIHHTHPSKCFWTHNPCYIHHRIGCKAQYCKKKYVEVKIGGEIRLMAVANVH